MSTKKDISDRLVVFASGIDFAIAIAERNNRDQVVFGVAEMKELTSLIREKICSDRRKGEVKMKLRDWSRTAKRRLEDNDPSYEQFKELCGMIDEVCG